MKLLIVDDHAGVRTMIRDLVSLPGDTVCECATGDDAVRVAREFAPDAVTMDVRLPGLGGFAATRAIRALVPSARVVIVSTYDQPELRFAAQTAGAADYLAKDHLENLRSVLLRRQPGNESSTAPSLSDRTGRTG